MAIVATITIFSIISDVFLWRLQVIGLERAIHLLVTVLQNIGIGVYFVLIGALASLITATVKWKISK